MTAARVARVRAPATSANLGPGFDSLGLALQLHDEVAARVTDDGLHVEVIGEGAALARDETHLVVRAMRATFELLDERPAGLALECTNRIPHGRGLGSSAAAIVCGVLLARALVADGATRLSDADAFRLAAAIEGHPDNVAACVFGGLTIARVDDGGPAAVQVDVAPALRPCLLIPPFESSTAAVRGLLPDHVPHGDAAFAAGRSALLVALLTGAAPPASADLLAATDDRLHQPYRAPALAASAELIMALRKAGHAAVVSGAGPSVLVLACDDGEAAQVLTAAPGGWSARQLAVATAGAQVILAAAAE